MNIQPANLWSIAWQLAKNWSILKSFIIIIGAEGLEWHFILVYFILVYYQVQAAANREAVGAFGDASLGRLEYGAGNIVGIHVDPNLNTGIGIRNGNVEAHLMGFGGKVGEDGLEINTPIGGANACNVMWFYACVRFVLYPSNSMKLYFAWF